VQGLRMWLEIGDWYLASNNTPKIISGSLFKNNKEIPWLPTGDQLDDETVKICKGNKKWKYEFLWSNQLLEYWANIKDEACYDKDMSYWIISANKNANPLIAKIQLLIKLLESGEK